MRTSFSAFSFPKLFRNLLYTKPKEENTLSIEPELDGQECRDEKKLQKPLGSSLINSVAN